MYDVLTKEIVKVWINGILVKGQAFFETGQVKRVNNWSRNRPVAIDDTDTNTSSYKLTYLVSLVVTNTFYNKNHLHI